MRTPSFVTTLVIALCIGSGLPACETVRGTPGPDGTTFTFGGLEGMMAGTPAHIVEVAEAVLRQKDLHILSSLSSGVDGKVVARTALEKKLQVEVVRQDDETCKVSIRVGTFGDKDLSREIFASIKAKL